MNFGVIGNCQVAAIIDDHFAPPEMDPSVEGGCTAAGASTTFGVFALALLIAILVMGLAMTFVSDVFG